MLVFSWYYILNEKVQLCSKSRSNRYEESFLDENLKLNLFVIGYDFALWAFWNSSSHSRMCTSKISNELSKFLCKIFSNTKFFLQFWMCISKILNELSKFHRQIFSNFNSRMCISNILNEHIFSNIFLIFPPILEDF